MADDPGTTTPDQPPDSDSGLDQRVTTLESKIDKILGIISRDPPAADEPEQPAGAPNVAHEIRQQLDERDAKAREDADKASLRDEVGALKTTLAELAEKPPEAMPRKVERIMGWR